MTIELTNQQIDEGAICEALDAYGFTALFTGPEENRMLVVTDADGKFMQWDPNGGFKVRLGKLHDYVEMTNAFRRLNMLSILNDASLEASIRTFKKILWAMAFMLMVITIMFIVSISTASAHKWTTAKGTVIDGSWIMNNRKISYCCGKRDCMPVTGRAYFDPIAEGWRVKGWRGSLKLGSKDIHYGTPDGHLWACYRKAHQYETLPPGVRIGDPILRCLLFPRRSGQ